MEQLPKQVGEAVTAAKTEGPDYKAFIDLTNKLKEMEHPQFQGKAMLDAWKFYRMAVGDWMITRVKEAEEEVARLREAGEIRESVEAYGEYKRRVERLQEFVRRSIGKRTDIYTEDKRFVHTGIAKAAGVYKSPGQIMKDIGEPLGEDPKTLEGFKSIVEGIKAETGKRAPVEAARDLFRDLSDMQGDFSRILADAEKFGRLGDEVLEAWDFEKLVARTTRLRTALQMVLKENKEMDAEQRKNVENVVKYLKKVESLYSHMALGGKQVGYGQTGIVPVPKFETPEVQKALHARNIQATREYFRRAEEAGGPEIGERFTYQEKIIGAAGETIKNVTHHFAKYGEELLSSGQKVGQFSESQQDLIEKMQRANATFGNAETSYYVGCCFSISLWWSIRA